MGKIYRRDTLQRSEIVKKKDEKARKRNTIINFRVTPTEKKLIESRISISGLSRSKFFIESCLYQAVLVKGNIKTFNEMKKDIFEIKEIINLNPNIEEL